MTEQQRHLRLVRLLAILVGAAIVILGAALYLGYELPFYEMREQHTDSTGYAPPPGMASVTAAGVPRHIDLQAGAPDIVLPLPPPPPRTGPGPAPVPPQALALVNPVAADPKAAQAGKGLYDTNCAQCHGGDARGNGPVGQSYTPPPPDLHPLVRAQPAGQIYYSITVGIRSTPVPTAARYLPFEWHGYLNLLTDRERWELVTYLQSVVGKQR